MKLVTFLLTFTLSTSAFANEKLKLTSELLKLLLDNSASVTVVDQDFNTDEKNLSAILSKTLASTTLGDSENKVLIDISSKCTDSTPKDVLGSSAMDCSLTIKDSGYKTTEAGLAGPTEVRSTVFTFKTNQVVVPNSEKTIEGNIVYVVRRD
ncbi:MAG: hypothetical protein V4596_10230 [Bdellovibrionota bacterium]